MLDSAKEEWAGCTELDAGVHRKWEEAKQCLRVHRQLERVGLMTLSDSRR